MPSNIWKHSCMQCTRISWKLWDCELFNMSFSFLSCKINKYLSKMTTWHICSSMTSPKWFNSRAKDCHSLTSNWKDSRVRSLKFYKSHSKVVDHLVLTRLMKMYMTPTEFCSLEHNMDTLPCMCIILGKYIHCYTLIVLAYHLILKSTN